MTRPGLSTLLVRWEEAHAVGLEIPATELCRDQPELASELQAAIDILRRMHGLIKPPSIAPPEAQTGYPVDTTFTAGSAPPRFATAPPGYTLLAEIGRGGMGVVYRARQLALDRVVVLKMILSGAHAGHEELARFQTEAEAIARLQHPNIVQVFETGSLADQPFLSMEFCAGGSLDRRLAGTPLAPVVAAQLTRTLAQAMQAAHDAGVIHRDLKPANVLLAEAASEAVLCPKITDFGLAKKLDTAGRTQSGAVMGTPSYMPPEQALGDRAIGPAADIYSLGAILYECLTGRPPFRAATVYDTLAEVVARDPVPPRDLNAQVPRDLETITLKCLRKDPAQRYARAEDLAQDLTRFLEGVPVLARPVGPVERLVKWGRRRPAIAGLVAGITTVTVVAFTVISLLYGNAVEQARIARNEAERAMLAEKVAEMERDQAQANLKLARSAVDDCFLVAKSHPLLQTEGARPVRRLLFAKALPFYERFQEQRPEDASVQGELANQHFRVAFITSEIGGPEEALAQWRKVLSLYETLAEHYPEVEEFAQKRAGSWNNLGLLLNKQGQRQEALRAFSRSRDGVLRLVAHRPGVAEYREELSLNWNNLGGVLSAQGRHLEAVLCWQEGLTLQRQLLREYPRENRYRIDLARLLANMSLDENRLEQRSRAIKDLTDARDLLRQALTGEARGSALNLLGSTLVNLGAIQADLGQKEAALASYTEAQQVLAGLVQLYPETPIHRQELARALGNRGNLDADSGRLADAIARVEQGSGLVARLVADFPQIAEYQHELAGLLGTLAVHQQKAGLHKKALDNFQQALLLRQKLVADHGEVVDYQVALARALTNLGLYHEDRKQPPQAGAMYRQATTLLTQLASRFPEDTRHRRELARTLYSQGKLQEDLGEKRAAAESYRLAVTLREKLLTGPQGKEERRQLARTLMAQERIEESLGHWNLALATAKRACEVWSDVVREQPEGQYHTELATARTRLASLYRDAGQLKEARDGYREVVELFSAEVKEHPENATQQDNLASALTNLGVVHGQLGEKRSALTCFARALPIQRWLVASFPNKLGHVREMARTLTGRGMILVFAGKHEEALADASAALALLAGHTGEVKEAADLPGLKLGAHYLRALALRRLGRHREAVPHLDLVIDLVPAARRDEMRYQRADSLVRSDSYRKASVEADHLAGPEVSDGEILYNLACIQAMCASASLADASRPLAEREKLSENCARASIALLRRAARAGLFRTAKMRTLLGKDEDLAPLRAREDYREFVQSLGQ